MVHVVVVVVVGGTLAEPIYGGTHLVWTVQSQHGCLELVSATTDGSFHRLWFGGGGIVAFVVMTVMPTRESSSSLLISFFPFHHTHFHPMPSHSSFHLQGRLGVGHSRHETARNDP